MILLGLVVQDSVHSHYVSSSCEYVVAIDSLQNQQGNETNIPKCTFLQEIPLVSRKVTPLCLVCFKESSREPI